MKLHSRATLGVTELPEIYRKWAGEERSIEYG
jgi:hypothetical protein